MTGHSVLPDVPWAWTEAGPSCGGRGGHSAPRAVGSHGPSFRVDCMGTALAARCLSFLPPGRVWAGSTIRDAGGQA